MTKASVTVQGICIVEPGLQDYHGHLFNYAASVHRGADRRNLQCRVLASTKCLPAIQAVLPIDNIFHPVHEFVRRSGFHFLLFAPFAYNFSVRGGLRSKRLGFLNERWVVFVGTADQTNIFAVASWLRRFPPAQAPTLVLVLRLTFYRHDLGRWSPQVLWYWAGLKLIERLARTYRVRLVTDSTALEDESRQLTSLPVHVLPIPHMDQAETETLTQNALVASRILTMASLGSARTAKGFHLLAEAIERLHAQRKMDGLCFTLHAFQHGANGEPLILKAIALLRGLNSPAVTLVEQQLGEQEYNQLVRESDVILIPYVQYKYRANTSGTFAEALAAAKPVVVTEGTWMSAQLAKYGAGVTCRDRDVDDLVRAILEARDNYPHLAAQAQARRAAWVAYHSPDNFVGELLKVVSGPA